MNVLELAFQMVCVAVAATIALVILAMMGVALIAVVNVINCLADWMAGECKDKK